MFCVGSVVTVTVPGMVVLPVGRLPLVVTEFVAPVLVVATDGPAPPVTCNPSCVWLIVAPLTLPRLLIRAS